MNTDHWPWYVGTHSCKLQYFETKIGDCVLYRTDNDQRPPWIASKRSVAAVYRFETIIASQRDQRIAMIPSRCDDRFEAINSGH
jgi:hypothetical protein